MLSRRRFLLAASASTALAALPSLAASTGARTRPMPVIFIGHGSPMNVLRDNAFTRQLQAWGKALPRPRAILSVSAHWLTPGSTQLGVQARPETIHDFGGFPQALHETVYPAPGSPALAREAAALLRALPTGTTEEWGLDHGTWTVLHHLYPKADVPVFQLSIDYAKPADHHYHLGRELAALRTRGVLIMGSGNVVHNLRATDRGAADSPRASRPWAQAFDDAVKKALAARDDQALIDYEGLGDAAPMAVPTPDHYFPLLYTLGAASRKESAGQVFEGFQAGTLSMRCVQFGA